MSALSLSSSNANRSSTAAPSLNECDEKPPLKCAGNGDASTSVSGLVKKTYHIINLFLRLSFILSIWLLILPKITFLVWKLTFVTSYGEAQRLFLHHLSTENILTNCLAGFMLTTVTPILGPLFVWEKYILGIITANLKAQIENVPFAELIGLHGPLFPVIEFALHVLACNIYTLGVINFMPMCLGRVIVHYTFLEKLYNPDPFIIGYAGIYSLFVLFREIVKIIRYNIGEPLIIKWFSFHLNRETINSLFRHFVSAMRYSMKMLKNAFFPVTYLILLPFLFGWLIDFSTVEMFGNSITRRVEFFTVSPFTSSFVHWLVGLFYLLQIGISLRLLRGVLSKNVKMIGLDASDPKYKSVRDKIEEVNVLAQACLLLIICAVFGCLIVLLVFLPVKLTMWITPSVFPLHISIYDTYTEMLFFHICVPFVIMHFDLRTIIKSLLRSWFTIVASTLGLTEFLLPNGDQENEKQVVTNFMARNVVVLILAWMTLLVVNTSLIVIPVSLGRSFLPIFNDMYAIITGSFMICGIIRGVRYCIEFIRTTGVADGVFPAIQQAA